MDNYCDKDCVANLDGICCLERCKGEISVKPNLYRGTVEQRKEFYEDAREAFVEYFGEEKLK